MKHRALLLLCAAVLPLAACSTTDDKAACRAYAEVLSDWATTGNQNDLAKDGVALKLRTEVAPLASGELRDDISVIADLFDDGGLNPSKRDVRAGEDIRGACAELEVEW